VKGGAGKKKGTGPSYLVSFGLSLVGAALIWFYLDVFDPLLSWLISVNFFTFFTYGIDKAAAIRGWSRVPERALLLLVLAGGTAGGMGGRWMFRHKTRKTSFRIKFWFVVLLQAGAIVAYYVWIDPLLFT